MATISFSLPEPMKRWVEAQARDGRDVSDVLSALIRREQERGDRIAAMQRLVDEARASGQSVESMRDLRERARATHRSP